PRQPRRRSDRRDHHRRGADDGWRLHRRDRVRAGAGHGPRGHRPDPDDQTERAVRLETDRAGLMALVTLRQGSPAHRAYVIGAWVLVALGLLYVVFAHKDWMPVTIFSLDKGFRISQINDVICFAIAILGLNLVIGYSGQLSLGQSAFVGLGA